MGIKINFFWLVAIILFCRMSDLSAYSFSAMNGMTGNKTFVLNPVFTNPITPSFESVFDPIIGYGFSDRFDFYLDIAGLGLFPWTGYSTSWIMLRFDLGGNNVIALQIGTQSEENSEGQKNLAFSITPQYHFFWENDRTAFELNLLAGIPWDKPETVEITSIIAPVYKLIKDRIHCFIEIDPEYTLGGEEKGYDISLQPGFWFGFADGAHQFCLSASVNDFIKGTPQYGVNLWYCFTCKAGQ